MTTKGIKIHCLRCNSEEVKEIESPEDLCEDDSCQYYECLMCGQVLFSVLCRAYNENDSKLKAARYMCDIMLQGMFELKERANVPDEINKVTELFFKFQEEQKLGNNWAFHSSVRELI